MRVETAHLRIALACMQIARKGPSVASCQESEPSLDAMRKQGVEMPDATEGL